MKRQDLSALLEDNLADYLDMIASLFWLPVVDFSLGMNESFIHG